jgi:hypothetical protein
MTRYETEAAAATAATVPAPTTGVTIIDDNDNDSTLSNKPAAIRLTIPPRLLLVPGTAVFTGLLIGFVRGSRAAGLRFLAENAHRAPRTVQGWYFYQKTKNYRVLLAGLRSGGLEALRLGAVAGTWVAAEEALGRVGSGMEDGKDIGAGMLTGLVFSGVCERRGCGWLAMMMIFMGLQQIDYRYGPRARVYCWARWSGPVFLVFAGYANRPTSSWSRATAVDDKGDEDDMFFVSLLLVLPPTLHYPSSFSCSSYILLLITNIYCHQHDQIHVALECCLDAGCHESARAADTPARAIISQQQQSFGAKSI